MLVRLLILLLWTAAAWAEAVASASERLVLDDVATRIDPRPHLKVLRDVGGHADWSAIQTRASEFVAIAPGADANFGYSGDAIWLRLLLRSTATRHRAWRFELNYPMLDQVDLLMLLDDGTTQHLRAGNTLPPRQRALEHRSPVFPVELAPGEERTLFLRVQSNSSLTLSPTLWDAAAFQVHSERGYAAQALYFGMLLALSIYNLLLYAALRDRAYLLYVAFVLSFGAGVAGLYGLGAQYLWPGWSLWSARALPVGIATCCMLALLFTRAFLDTAQRSPFWHRLLGYAALLQLGVALFTGFGPPQAAVMAMSASGIVMATMVMACGIGCARQGVPGARVFVLAWSMLLLGGVALALRNFGLIPTSFITMYSMQLGSALEMLLLSFALAARFNQLKRDKEAAQAAGLAAQSQAMEAMQRYERELEEKVAERTEALAAANIRLQQLALSDPLTGLANRAALTARLEQALSRVHQQGVGLTVLLIDLDGFKAINDRHGHEAGDQVLREVANRLREEAGSEHLVGRLGGDEFVLVCGGVEGHAAHALAERLLIRLAEPLVVAEGEIVAVEASIGIASAQITDEDGRHLLRRADQAMYAVKGAGRSGIRRAERTLP